MMICSRERPRWATARKFVHLEVFEVGAPDLAFDETEVAQLMPSASMNVTLREEARGVARGDSSCRSLGDDRYKHGTRSSRRITL